MRSTFCADKIIECSASHEDGMGIADTLSGVMSFTFVANYQEDLMTYERSYSDA